MHAQITLEERYAIAAMKRQGLSVRAMSRELGRPPSTISREIARNRTVYDGAYRAERAHAYMRRRRSHSRRNSRFSADDWVLVNHLIGLDWSPEQVAGWLALHGILSISHETIYLRVWEDKAAGGELWRHMRQAMKKRRKRYRSRDSRGRLAGKRHISERPSEIETRAIIGHWEIDTVKGDDQARHTILTIVERMTGYVPIGKLARHNAAETSARCIELTAPPRLAVRNRVPVLEERADQAVCGFRSPWTPIPPSSRSPIPVKAITLGAKRRMSGSAVPE
jgi:IS30 family transposase